MRNTFIYLLTISCILFARSPEEKSGTIAIMKAHAEGRLSMIDSYEPMRPSLPYNYDTPEGHFRVHYDLSGYNAVDSVDYVHKIGQYLEQSWSFYMDTLGYLPPPSDGMEGGDGRYDVYLRDISAYGQTWPGGDGPQPWFDWSSYIEIENDFDGVYPNDDPEGAVMGAMKITCAHEFHHAVQYGLCGTSGAWIAELTSVYYEERVYPQVNDYVWLIEYLTTNPELPLDWESGYHMYGLGLFSQYFGKIHGDGFLASVWDTMRFIEDWPALCAISDIRAGGLPNLYSEFAAMALLIGGRDCGFFPDGPALSDMGVENTHHSYPTGGSTSNRPYGFGSNYIVFQGFPAEDTDLIVDFHGEQTIDWHVLSIWKSGDSVAIRDGVRSDTAGVIVVPMVNEAEFAAIAVVPSGDTRTRYTFSYSADIAPSAIEEHRIPRGKELVAAYPNPFNASCIVEAEGSQVEIFDNSGRIVATLPLTEGRTRWSGTNSLGEALPSGLYLIRTEKANSLYPIVLLK